MEKGKSDFQIKDFIYLNTNILESFTVQKSDIIILAFV